MRIPLFISTALLIFMPIWALFIWDPETMGPTARSSSEDPLELASEPEGGDFTLKGEDGVVSLSDLRGQVLMLYFGYTFSPQRTPMAVGTIAAALDALGSQAKEHVQGVFISLDPRRDTPERVATFAEHFDEGIIGLTGEDEAIEAVAERYGVARRLHSGTASRGYTIDHSSYYYILDPEGELVAWLPPASTPRELAEVVAQHLAETHEKEG
ncbi:MAG: SCO family protein [Halorhodospira sp.]